MRVLEVILWVLFGALTGWIIALMVRTDNRFNPIVPCLIGIVGAITGGILFNIYGYSDKSIQANSIFSAVVGAVFLLTIIEFMFDNNKRS